MPRGGAAASPWARVTSEDDSWGAELMQSGGGAGSVEITPAGVADQNETGPPRARKGSPDYFAASPQALARLSSAISGKDLREGRVVGGVSRPGFRARLSARQRASRSSSAGSRTPC